MLISTSSVGTGAIIIALATFVGALIGSIAQFWLDRRRRQRRKKNLRIALKSELENHSNVINDIWPSPEKVGDRVSDQKKERINTYHEMVPSQVYKANLSEIDELSNIEVEVLTAYYGYVSNTPSVLNSFEETKESLLDPEIAAQNISNQLDVGEFDRKEESIIKDLIKTIYAKDLEDEDLADELRDMEEDIIKNHIKNLRKRHENALRAIEAHL
jgi:hypothetical protein